MSTPPSGGPVPGPGGRSPQPQPGPAEPTHTEPTLTEPALPAQPAPLEAGPGHPVGLAVYRHLLRTPGAAAFSAAALVGRLPISMLGIGSVLLLEEQRDSIGTGGLVAGGFALGQAFLAPQVSRWIDRHGQLRVLPGALAVHLAALLSLIALTAATSVTAVVLVALAVVAGGALPPNGACTRARWAHLLGRTGRKDEVPAAFALESVADEVVFVGGPLLIVLGAALGSAVTGLLLAAFLVTTGTLALAAQRSTQPPPVLSSSSLLGAMRSPGLRVLVLAMAAVGVVFGSLEVVMVAFAEQRGSETAAGPLLALIALGSGIAGLTYGARRWRAPLSRRFLLALAGLALGVVPLLLVPSLWLMAPAGLLAGIAIAPTLIASFGLAEQLVDEAVRTEGFTWLNSGLGAGVAIGSAVGGLIADGPGARWGFLTCLVGALLAVSVATAGRRTLTPDPA